MKVAIYPGSFDPITLGHLDIVCRGAKMFDKLIVAVLQNSSKTPLFTVEERVEMIRKSTKDLPNVEVASFSGLLADYAAKQNATAVIRGLRALSDFEYEFQMALTNKKLNPELETVFLATRAKYMYFSSSIVKEIARNGGNIKDFVPAVVREDIQNRLCKGAEK